jgi:hypothetical protein
VTGDGLRRATPLSHEVGWTSVADCTVSAR